MSTVFILGGAGQLGAVVVDAFKAAGYKVITADFRENDRADVSIAINTNLEESKAKIIKATGEESMDAVLTFAGGWAGENIASDAMFEAAEKMWNMNVKSALLAGAVASKILKPNGKLVFTGAKAALGGTHFMIGYGISKAATHQLVASLAQKGSGLPEGTTVCAVLPVTLDTKTNRSGMPNADFSSWTPLEEVAKKVLAWVKGTEAVGNGDLMIVETKDGQTSWTKAQHQ